MHSLAHYALFGSLCAGAAGALILATVTVKHGFKRHVEPETDQPADDLARRQRVVRLADAVAVLCFAVSAGLGVVGLMQHTRPIPPAAVVDHAPIIDRLHALETRVASAELGLQSRPGPVAEWRVWQDRLASLESRMGAVEERASVAERRVPLPKAPAPRAIAPAAVTPVTPRPTPAKPEAPAVVSAPPRVPAADTSVPSAVATSPAPESRTALEGTPRIQPPAPVAVAPPPREARAKAEAPLVREPARAKPEPPAAELPILDKIRQDWETVKSDARRGGDEWREGWEQLKRLFR